jgi:hypothetical protein
LINIAEGRMTSGVFRPDEPPAFSGSIQVATDLLTAFEIRKHYAEYICPLRSGWTAQWV